MIRRTFLLCGALSGLLALTAAVGVTSTPAAAAPAGAAPPTYPAVGAGTHLVDHTAALAGFSDPEWYEANIPFLDVPDQQVQDVYYYRWRTYKEHLRYTDPQDGWTSTEFLDCCGYAAPYQNINAAAGHQITEGRWLRDTTYGDDLVRFWTTGPGAGAKPATEGVNPSTTGWAHEYSFWLASAAYGRAQATGDTAQLTTLLPQLVRQYRGWDGQYDGRLGLYWSVPVWDAMELSASSYRSDDPYHGGAGFRPTLNSYQYGDAVAIAAVAKLAGDSSTAAEYTRRAAALKTAMAAHLWDADRDFFFHVARDGNPHDLPLDTREEIGFIPWAFDAAPVGYEAAWQQLFDPQGFASAFGPTTAERRSPLFMYEAGSCCRWDGPSWPFSTSQTLTGMANLLDDYPAQGVVTAGQYAAQLHTYAATQFRDGRPYVAEAHSPDDPEWIYDGANHSEDYNHSTFDDLVISGLVGLRPATGNRLPIKPLVPATWDHFALENVPYHGHNVTVAYDADGSHYADQGLGIGRGMSVYVDGVRVSHTARVQAVTVTIPAAPAVDPAATRPVDDAANPLRAGYPKPIASYTWQGDDPWNALDGKVFFDEVPENTRWTNYSSPNAQDWYGVDFGVPTPVSDLRWYGYDDGGGVRPAVDYRVQYLTGGTWTDVPGQQRSSTTPVGNGLNRITFPEVTASRVRLLFTNPPGAFVGVTELQAWSASSPALALSTTSGSPVVVDSRATLTVAVRNTTDRPLTGVSLTATASAGWRVTGAPPTFSVPAGASVQRTLTVVAPSGVAAGSDAAVRVAAGFTRDGVPEGTHRQFALRTAFPTGPALPVGAWPLDEGSGTVAHDTADDHDLTVTGHPAWTAGTRGTALQLDGATAATTSGPVLDTAGSFTVAATVRLDTTDGFQTAVGQDDTTTSGFFLQYSGSDGRFAFSTEQGRALANTVPVTGRWYRLVGVHDANAGTYTLYVDGAAQTSVLHLDPGDASTGPLTVGRAKAGGTPTDFWHGALDEVRVWARALPAGEVAALR